jgi:tetratricopeptide (TPR) repeat protein
MAQCADTAVGRRRFVQHLDNRAQEEGIRAGVIERGEDRRYSHLRHGWYWGSQAFAERMLQLAGNGTETRRNRTYRSAPLFQAHNEKEARRLLEGGLAAAGLSARELDSLPGSDVRKVALASLILERTVARQSWIADKLAMRSAANVSQQALDPRNVQLLMGAAWTYAPLRKFPAALRLYDRALDITPDDPDVMAGKARIYQAEGNLQEAAKSLSEINAQTPSEIPFQIKITQLTLERNYSEAIRLLQARQNQFNFTSEIDKGVNQLLLAWTQRLASDTAGAKVTGEKARATIDLLYGEQPDNFQLAVTISQAYAVMGEKDSALREAQRAITLLPRAKDPASGPALEQNLALIQMAFGQNSSAISTLRQLLQTPYDGELYATPITPALLRLDPLWDPLRSDPAFQKLCEEKQP